MARHAFSHSVCKLLALFALSGAALRASENSPPLLYEVTTETGMPHLEENLRYAVTREERCLTREDLFLAFPVLQHASLSGCTLQDESRGGDTVSFHLACDGGHGTTGSATWRIGDHLLRGTLNVKLGGKNMTFYQRVTARPLRNCDSTQK